MSSDMPNMIQGIHSDDLDAILKYSIQFRKVLSKGTAAPHLFLPRAKSAH